MEENLNFSSKIETIVQDEDIFEFETESMALKGNKNYYKMLGYLNLLTALRTQAFKDYEKVLSIEDEALADPLRFVRKIKHNEDIGIPHRLHIPELPVIDWSKYKMHPLVDAIRPTTRPKLRESESIKSKEPTEHTIVRGRPKTSEKPATYNKPWTPEEQLRLEELLLKFPPEANEARRFAKIAEALGNRTLSQVTSRCQKYFIKLHKAGLPVPGRIPRWRRDVLRNGRSKATGQRQLSSFFPRAFPPVSLTDDGDLPGTASIGVNQIKTEPIDPDDASDMLRGSSEGQKLVLLRRVRADLTLHGNEIVMHAGFMCNICKEEPLRGTRWHCVQCSDVDFCSSCLINQLEGEPQHPLDHYLASCRPTMSRAADQDYASEMGQYNYLDPNFQPD